MSLLSLWKSALTQIKEGHFEGNYGEKFGILRVRWPAEMSRQI
jgi:hypothetical protein